MIVDHNRIDLFGKMLFEKATIIPPFKKPHPMPDEACFLYVREGEYNAISQNGQLRIKAEESVLMKCGHYLSQMYRSKRSTKYEAVAVHFFPDVLQKAYDNKIPKFLKEPKNKNGPGMSKVNSDVPIRKYIESILFYFDNPSLVSEEILILKLKEIILLLNQTRNAAAIHHLLSNLFDSTTYTFREIIEANLYSQVSTEELAQLTNRSLSTFKREFKKIYHTSPASYIRDKKLEKAAELLVSSELRMTEIAFDCGFSDLAHLSKSFRLKFGCPPSAYRLSHFDKSLSQS